MSAMDPTEIFRQEASELFEVLEGALLDLGQRPDDRELVDSAFRALHTIKGSGAMFGFDKVASFTHEFETAFDRVRKGEIKPTQELISVALAAKDYIRALIEDPQSTDDIIGEAILDDLKRFVFPDQPAAPVAEIAERRRWPPVRASRPAGTCIWNSNPTSCATARTRSICWKTFASSALLRRARYRRHPVPRRAGAGRLLSEVGRQAARRLRQGRDRRRLHVRPGRDEADALAA